MVDARDRAGVVLYLAEHFHESAWSALAVAMAWLNRTGLRSLAAQQSAFQQNKFVISEQALHVAGGNIRRSFHLALGLVESALYFRATMLLNVCRLVCCVGLVTRSA